MNEIINLNELKEGDYIYTEFTYFNDETEQDEIGFCKGIVKRYIPNWRPTDEENDGYGEQPTIECSKLLTVEGIEPDDGDFFIGVGDSIDIRYMTEREIEEFNLIFNI